MSDTLTQQPVAGTVRDPMPELRRILGGRKGPSLPDDEVLDPDVASMVEAWAEDGAVCPPARFQAEGDAVLLLGDWRDGEAAEGASVLRTTVAGLLLAGTIRSARLVREGGVLVALADSLGTDGAGGAVVDGVPVGEAAVPLEQFLFGEAPNRIVAAVRGEDAGRVVKQSKILGVPALRIATVGGAGLVVRVGDQEWREAGG